MRYFSENVYSLVTKEQLEGGCPFALKSNLCKGPKHVWTTAMCVLQTIMEVIVLLLLYKNLHYTFLLEFNSRVASDSACDHQMKKTYWPQIFKATSSTLRSRHCLNKDKAPINHF